MDVKEIKTLMSQLDKPTDDATTLKLLGILQKRVRPTEQLLRETKVGVCVNKLRALANGEVVALVKKIIKLWKDEVAAEKRLRAKPAAPVPDAPFVSDKPRTPKADGVLTEVHGDSTRNALIGAFYLALAIGSTDPPALVLLVSREIEEAVFRQAGAVNDGYRNKLRSLVMNIRNKNNPELRERLLGRLLKATKVVELPPSALAPEGLKKEIEELQKKNLFDAQGATEKRAITDRFTCGKCKEKKVSYYQMQTRSADEPLTTFCTCENCGNRWKFS